MEGKRQGLNLGDVFLGSDYRRPGKENFYVVVSFTSSPEQLLPLQKGRAEDRNEVYYYQAAKTYFKISCYSKVCGSAAHRHEEGPG